MSMTKSEFQQRYQRLRTDDWERGIYGGPPVDELTALAEEAGVEWASEPTPEPTGDLQVRVIDAAGDTWRPGIRCWIRLVEDSAEYWSEVPQPATVLRPEGDNHA